MSDRVSNKKSGLKGSRQYQYMKVSARRRRQISALQERMQLLDKAHKEGRLSKEFNYQEEEWRIKKTIRSFLPKNVRSWLASKGRQLTNQPKGQPVGTSGTSSP